MGTLPTEVSREDATTTSSSRLWILIKDLHCYETGPR